MTEDERREYNRARIARWRAAKKAALLQSDKNGGQDVTRRVTCNKTCNTSCNTADVTRHVTKPVTNHVTNQPKSLKSDEKSGCYTACYMLQARERNEEKEEKERSKEKEEREEKKEFKKENPKEKSFVTGGVTKPVTDFLFPELENQGAQESKEKASPDEDFQKFWAVWPRKVAKAEAVKAFSSLWKAKKLPKIEDLIAAVRLQRSELDWTRENFRFCPHPATWLRAQRWADEIGGVKSFAISKMIPERAAVSAENQKPRPQILQKTVSESTCPENPKNSNFEAKPETVTTAPNIYDEHLALIERGRRREAALASVLSGQPITKESWLDIPELQRAVFLRKNGLSVKDVKFK